MSSTFPVLPLNDFQRLMRYWDEFQPFSGIDAIEVRGHVDADHLRACAEEELALLGIGLPIVAADGRSVTYRPGRPDLPVEVIHPAAGIAGGNALAEQCSIELNRSFRVNVDPLIRLWVVATVPHSHVGMTWQHWPMDGVCGADLFRRILSRYVGSPLRRESTSTELIAPDVAGIRPRISWRRQFGYLRETLREIYRVSRTFAPPRPCPEHTVLRVHLLELSHPRRPEGAMVNDVIAAAVMWALADAFPERHGNYWRQRLNLLNFIDLRPFGGEKLRRAWGVFLAFFVMNMPEPRPVSIDDLIRCFRDQSLWARNQQTFFASLSGLSSLRRAWRWVPRRWRWSLPRRLLPISAGLTNSRHRAEWNAGRLGEQFGRSWRIAPLGSMTALTVDVCTKGDQLSLALTCEDPSFVSARIEAIKANLVALLHPSPGRH